MLRLILKTRGINIRNALKTINVRNNLFFRSEKIRHVLYRCNNTSPFFFVSPLSRTFKFGLRRVRFTREQQGAIVGNN